MEIAIIAHDGKKADMVQFLNRNSTVLKKENIKIIATGTTGSKAEAAGFKVKKMLAKLLNIVGRAVKLDQKMAGQPRTASG